MKKAIFFVYFICLVVSGLSAQNWDINTLHRVNSWDGKFVPKNQKEYWFTATNPRDNISLLKSAHRTA